MKQHLPETDYRFDRVDPRDRQACLNWEYEREFRRREGESPLKPWLELEPQECAAAHKFVGVWNYAETRPLVSWATSSESKSAFLTDPTRPFMRKVVTLPPITIQWTGSDPTLVGGFRRLIAEWVKEQRRTDPSASRFSGKSRIGKPTNVLGLLADLAIYRLRRRKKFSAHQILTALQDFEKLDGASPRLIQGKVFEGNLGKTCRRVDTYFAS